ncbi:MAG: formylglycine-generating enzyme family protein [Planctomycetota bacterium]
MRHPTPRTLGLALTALCALPSCLSWGGPQERGIRQVLPEDFKQLEDAGRWNGWPRHIEHEPTGLRFRLVLPGRFVMGASPDDADADDDEGPPREVVLTRAFYLAETEVTVGSWRAYVENEGHQGFVLTAPSWAEKTGWGDDRPACNLTWSEAGAFCRFYGFRLPSEAEWEYACRAGTTTPWCFGRVAAELDRHAWYGQPDQGAHAVAQKEANPWGFHDMYGNVAEWVADGYDAFAYREARRDPLDPHGPAESFERVVRGGSFASEASATRSSERLGLSADRAGPVLGFRPAFDLPPLASPPVAEEEGR